jgi:nucleoside-diphosphate-sugar epimerase
MNFLVTGGAGFIGSHVCERLLGLGHAVWTLDDLNPFYAVALKQQNLAALERGLGRSYFLLVLVGMPCYIVRDVRFSQQGKTVGNHGCGSVERKQGHRNDPR